MAFLCLLVAGCRGIRGDGDEAKAPGAGEPPAWEIKNPPPTESPLNPVVPGRNSFVSYALKELRYSADGKTWRSPKLPAMDPEMFYIRDVAYGQGRFVALIGQSIFASPDGSAWTKQAESAHYPASIAFGDSAFAVVGTGCVMASRDGLDWKTIDMDTSMVLNSVAFGNGRFVATRGWPEEIWSSRDGLAWSKVKEALKRQPDEEESRLPFSVLFGNGRFLTFGLRNYESTDGLTWTLLKQPLVPDTRPFFVNDRFVVFQPGGDAGKILLTSADLSAWRRDTSDLPFLPDWIGFFHGHYVTREASSHVPHLSRDLVHWAPPEMATTQYLKAVAFGGMRFVAAGLQGTLLSSLDGSTWEKAKVPAMHDLNAVAFGNGTFVVVGDSGTLLASRDGRFWTKADTTLSENVFSLCFDKGAFIAVTSPSRTMFRSQDGKTWRFQGALPPDSYEFLCADGKYFAYGGVPSISSDGVHWEKSLLGTLSGASVRFDGHRFLLESSSESGSMQLVSDEGVYWRQSHSGRMPSLEILPDRKGEFQLVGGRIYWVSEGTTYAVDLPRGGYSRATYGKGMFVAVGNAGTIAVLRAEYPPERRPGPARRAAEGKPDPFQDRRFYCQMEHELIAVLKLTSDGENLKGEYSYLGRTQSLRLKGTLDPEGRFHVQEYTDAGQSTGAFDGKISGTEVIGEWSNSDHTRHMRFEGYEATQAQIEERLRRFKAQNRALIGVYSVTRVYEKTEEGEHHDCALVNGRWACGNGDYLDSWQEPIQGREPGFGLKSVEAIRFEVTPDFTMELSVKGEKRWVVPLEENRMAYDEGAYFIAKGIKIRELEAAGTSGDETARRAAKKPFTLKLSPEGNAFLLDQSILFSSDERRVDLRLEKIR